MQQIKEHYKTHKTKQMKIKRLFTLKNKQTKKQKRVVIVKMIQNLENKNGGTDKQTGGMKQEETRNVPQKPI